MLKCKNNHFFFGLGRKIEAGQSNQRQVTVVARKSTHMEWQGHHNTPTTTSGDNRCIRAGMGSLVTDNQEAQGLWSIIQQKYSNNTRELLAGIKGLHYFEASLTGKVVSLQMDNTTAISYIKQDGRKSELTASFSTRPMELGIGKKDVNNTIFHSRSTQHKGRFPVMSVYRQEQLETKSRGFSAARFIVGSA